MLNYLGPISHRIWIAWMFQFKRTTDIGIDKWKQEDRENGFREGQQSL
jgi:hypothetical protein